MIKKLRRIWFLVNFYGIHEILDIIENKIPIWWMYLTTDDIPYDWFWSELSMYGFYEDTWRDDD